MSAILCLDVGSTAIKAALVDKKQHVYDFVSMNLPPSASLSNLNDYFFEIIKKITRHAVVDIDAVALCGNGPSLVVNPHEDDAYCIYWYSKHAQVSQQLDSYYLPLFLQLDKTERSSVRTLMALPEYLCSLLGGASKTILPCPAYESYILSRKEQITYAIPDAFLRNFHSLHDPIGQVHPDMAARTHLPAEIPIFCGGTDYLMDILGSGQYIIGDVIIRTGTRAVCNCILDGTQSKNLTGFTILPYIGKGIFTAAIFLPKSVDGFVIAMQKEIKQTDYRELSAYLFETIEVIYKEQCKNDSNAMEYRILKHCAERLVFRYRLDILEERTALSLRKVHISGEQSYYGQVAPLDALLINRELKQSAFSETALLGLAKLAYLGGDVYGLVTNQNTLAQEHHRNATSFPEKHLEEQISRLYAALTPQLQSLQFAPQR